MTNKIYPLLTYELTALSTLSIKMTDKIYSVLTYELTALSTLSIKMTDKMIVNSGLVNYYDQLYK